MVQAAKGLVAIMVDGSAGVPAELKERFQVSGFPTVLFTNPQGEQVEQLAGRDPGAVRSQIERVISQHSSSLFMEDLSVAEGLALAQEQGKLLAVLFASSDKADKVEGLMAHVVMNEQLAPERERFLWLLRPAKDGRNGTDEAKELKVRKGGTLLLLNPAGEAEKPSERVIKRITSPRRLGKDLKRALAKAEK